MDQDGDQQLGEEADAYRLEIRLELPDLVVESPQAPAEVANGQLLPVAWTVRNAGPTVAAAAWTDRAVLSRDRFLGNNDDVLIGQFVVQTDLQPGGLVQHAASVQVPFLVSTASCS